MLKVGKNVLPLPNLKQDKIQCLPLVETAFIFYRTIECFSGIPRSRPVARMCFCTPALAFFCEFREIFKNTYFQEPLRTAVSVRFHSAFVFRD